MRERTTGHGSDDDESVRTVHPLRVSRLEENLGADAVTLTPDQLRRLDELAALEGEHHTAEQMQLIER
ncbi:MAG: hypothetical protein AVDCRST_MAG54-2197 [uncultured Actinomycetospora sp.]|uniref:Uncharacterized protein n=1 Tax=uncultured Actinomycetospora sp. TaxID=1135996 RepID=A0A6J4IP83_9PSEU|nr:MAG: hypothetical protein AVDCRST_MAG54-2197 [uncultured Actinomycetospora sp.]